MEKGCALLEESLAAFRSAGRTDAGRQQTQGLGGKVLSAERTDGRFRVGGMGSVE